jgi:hypothetical protein
MTCHRNAIIVPGHYGLPTVPDVRLFLAPYADMSNWIKRLAGC